MGLGVQGFRVQGNKTRMTRKRTMKWQLLWSLGFRVQRASVNQMSYGLNSLKGIYVGDCIRDDHRGQVRGILGI